MRRVSLDGLSKKAAENVMYLCVGCQAFRAETALELRVTGKDPRVGR